MATQGERLQELMKKYQLNQTDFANKLGIPKSSVCMYTSNKRKLKQDRIKQISELFHVNEAWIMGYDVPMSTRVEFEPINNDAFQQRMSAYAIALLNNINSLNSEGQEKLLERLEELKQLPQYQKEE